jgi:hypothetical protein
MLYIWCKDTNSNKFYLFQHLKSENVEITINNIYSQQSNKY